MTNSFLNTLAARDVLRHRKQLLEIFQESQSLLIGTFNVGIDDILNDLRAKYCYIVAAEVNSSGKASASPDSSSRVFTDITLQERIAGQHAMLRLIKGHHAKYWVSGLATGEVARGVIFSGDLMPSALSINEPSKNSHELLLVLNEFESCELAQFGKWIMQCRPAKDILSTHNQTLSGNIAALPKFNHLLLTQPNRSLRKDVLSLIDEAEHSVLATTWLLEGNCEVTKRLAAAARTKQVTILAHDDSTNHKAFELLLSSGAKVHICPKMHAKIILIDKDYEPSAVVTSANLLDEGYETGFELGIRLSRGDVRIREVLSFFSERVQLCQPFVASENIENKKTHTDSLKNLNQIIKITKPIRIF